jgi:triphosphoribosyl-dephospho-CoA synthase
MNHDKLVFSQYAARAAVLSLIEEVELTPKPGLVDSANSGAHNDLTIDLMRKSAESLEAAFKEMASVSYGLSPSQALREEIAAIGRKGEKTMFKATGGINTHKGAIWALGLLVSAAAIGKGSYTIEKIVEVAGEIARFPDRYCPIVKTNGSRVATKYGVNGARGEAQRGFPHIMHFSLPALMRARAQGMSEDDAQLCALLALIAHLDDTCILHRGGAEALSFAKSQAAAVLNVGRFSELQNLNDEFTRRNISPGGSADLLAATLFLDKIQVNKVVSPFRKEYEYIH